MFSRVHLLYASQSGRAKACARRVERALRTHCPALQVTAPRGLDEAVHSSSLEEAIQEWKCADTITFFFISTTGDGEPPDAMRNAWRALLRRSLPVDVLQGMTFTMFALGDRAYGPQFCAAARKFAVRSLQLGAVQLAGCAVAYGDDGTPGGGCFADLDHWIEQQVQPALQALGLWRIEQQQLPAELEALQLVVPYQVNRLQKPPPQNDNPKLHHDDDKPSSLWHLEKFFATRAPLTAYRYKDNNNVDGTLLEQTPLYPLQGTVTENQRITAADWEQDTRHLTIQVTTQTTSTSLPYQAGDVVSILPVNSSAAVERFLSVLPAALKNSADEWIEIDYNKGTSQTTKAALILGVGFARWPRITTLRQFLTNAADIAALPEREDLWALSHYCNQQHAAGAAQREKLQALSETAAAALYTDYILRNKRGWADVLHDFDSIRYSSGNDNGDASDESSRKLTVAALVSLLSPMRPREFSIASAPSTAVQSPQPGDDCTGSMTTFTIDLTVAVVQGTTPLGRSYHGLCSHYLAGRTPGDCVRLWIRPGSFGHLPVDAAVPVLYMGAGTGIAPLRGLIRERAAHSKKNHEDSNNGPASTTNETDDDQPHKWTTPDILLFGCRKKSTDFYYQEEWNEMVEQGTLTLLAAFSRDQWHKFYVQQRLRQEDPEGAKLLHHLVQAGGHLYIAGGAKMARALKQEIVELLEPHFGDQNKATQYLAQLQRKGRFRVEAWS